METSASIVPSETAASEIAKGFDSIGGAWKVGAIYYNGTLIDINDNDALASHYDSEILTFNEDGSFVYMKKYGDKGNWALKGEEEEGLFMLQTASVFTYDLENGMLVEKEVETSSKRNYIAELADENTLFLQEYDVITGKGRADKDPLVFVKQGEDSSFIAEYKTEIKDTGNTQTADNSPASKKSSTTESKTASSSSESSSSGEKNALAKAQQYLDAMAFSYTGLVEQLEYEGFSHKEAVYGAEHCNADWYEQAAEKARDYLNVMPFSRSELIEQLEYEGFTNAEAEYGVNKVY
jgi:hypothetical protein